MQQTISTTAPKVRGRVTLDTDFCPLRRNYDRWRYSALQTLPAWQRLASRSTLMEAWVEVWEVVVLEPCKRLGVSRGFSKQRFHHLQMQAWRGGSIYVGVSLRNGHERFSAEIYKRYRGKPFMFECSRIHDLCFRRAATIGVNIIDPILRGKRTFGR